MLQSAANTGRQISPFAVRLGFGLILLVLCASCAPYGGKEISGFSIAPDGSRIAIGWGQTGAENIYWLNADGSNLTRLSGTPFSASTPSVSPDGKTILFEMPSQHAGPWHVDSMNADGSNLIQLTSGYYPDGGAAYSPDGSHIIFTRATRRQYYRMVGMLWEGWDLWLMNADGSLQRRLPGLEDLDVASAPCFAPNARRVVFAARRYPEQFRRQRLYTLDFDSNWISGNPREMPLPPTDTWGLDFVRSPSFSPDGSRIIFVLNRPDRSVFQLWSINLDGTDLRQITHTKTYGDMPQFSPDGKLIDFISGSSELWQIRPDGSDARKLFPNQIR